MTKLFTFLKQLSRQELKKMEELVNANYFNKRDDVRLLFQAILKNPKNHSEERLFKVVFPNQSFQKRDWHLLCSRLFKLGEKMLILEELEHRPVQQKMILAQAYRKKKRSTSFNSTIAATKKILEKQALRDANYWRECHTLAYEYYDFVASHNRKNKTNLQEVADALDSYYITNKLKTACLAYTRSTINLETYNIRLLEEVISYIENHPDIIAVPSVKMYYLCYKAITDNQQEHWFTELRHTINEYQDHFRRAEQRDIFLLATNYCIRRLNEGKTIFIKEAFELYRLSLTAGFLIEDGIMPESTFGNMVTLATKLKQYTWAQTFVEENRHFLKPVFQQPLYFYSMGRLLYESGDYDDSMRFLAQVDTKASFLLLATKVLQIKIYYEQKEFEALDYLLESLRVNLQRRKNLGYRKRNYEQLIYFTRKLMELPYQTKEKKTIFLKELNEAEGFSEREWIRRLLLKLK